MTEKTLRAAHKSPSARGRLLGLRGINNLGNTCFISSVLQALVHNPFLRTHYLALCEEDAFIAKSAPRPGETGHLGDIGQEIKRAVNEMFCGTSVPYNPQALLMALWRSVEGLAGYAQQDAHEFFIAAINGMHAASHGDEDTPRGKPSSVVHQVFGGRLQSDVICGSCGSISSRTDPFYDVGLDIRPPKHQLALGISRNGPSSLDDSLERYTSPECLQNDEKPFCARCGTHQESTKQFSFARLPQTICFHLKRFEHTADGSSVKLDNEVSFPATGLDLQAHTTSHITAQRGSGAGAETTAPGQLITTYELIAVVEHIGTMEAGHYIAYVRRRGTWFRCDDACVEAAEEEDVVGCKGYLLFYAQSPN